MDALKKEAPVNSVNELWRPDSERIERAKITDYQRWLSTTKGLQLTDCQSVWEWSVSDLTGFWSSVWEYFELPGEAGDIVLSDQSMPGSKWFPEAQLNYVDQVFRHATADRPAIIFESENGQRETISWSVLQKKVAALAATFRAQGVQPGDCIAAYLPNTPHAVVAFLACASIGAIWSVCSPDTGAQAVLDRFKQIQPRLLLAVDGYVYGGKEHDRKNVLQNILEGLPSVETLIMVPYLNPQLPTEKLAEQFNAVGQIKGWDESTGFDAPWQPEPLPFDHPLWAVYSSGTTGLPKPIVHGHGGIMLEHVKLWSLHNDVGPQDRVHWYSTTGWIMWNLQVGVLLVGATACLYDGHPAWPDQSRLWQFAGSADATFFGAGAAFYTAAMKHGVEPRKIADLKSLRSVGSTGSPLPPEGYQWLYEQLGNDIFLNPICGGTDIASAFIGGVPTLPIYSGEMQARCLGAAVQAFDDDGNAVNDMVGEMVCTEPMPSMPLYFLGDEDGERYRDSYFSMYPGVWRQGDWVQITPRGGAVVYGRSDTTINRQGIRMGTSEIYRIVEDVDLVMDSLVVDLEYLGSDSYMPLFVVLQEGTILTDEIKQELVTSIRSALSARHVPSEIFQVKAIPRTLSGKKLELPIKKLLLGHPVDKVVNKEAITGLESLSFFENLATKLAQNRKA